MRLFWTFWPSSEAVASDCIGYLRQRRVVSLALYMLRGLYWRVILCMALSSSSIFSLSSDLWNISMSSYASKLLCLPCFTMALVWTDFTAMLKAFKPAVRKKRDWQIFIDYEAWPNVKCLSVQVQPWQASPALLHGLLPGKKCLFKLQPFSRLMLLNAKVIRLPKAV